MAVIAFVAFSVHSQAFVLAPPTRRRPLFAAEAEVPSPDLTYSDEEALATVMNALGSNDEPYKNAGLEVCFNFSNDMCRAAVGGSLEEFFRYATNPTFSCLVDHKNYEARLSSRMKKGKFRGPMSTFVVDVAKKSGGSRSFLFTLEKQRRPPLQDCWLVRECLAVDKAIYQTI